MLTPLAPEPLPGSDSIGRRAKESFFGGDSRLTQSWHSGACRKEVIPPLIPRAQSYADGTDDPYNSSRTFGGIERRVRPKMPTAEQRAALDSFSSRFQDRYHEKPHIVAFVNSRSGGQIGGLLMEALTASIGRSGGAQAFTGKVCDLSHPDEPARTIGKLAEGLSGRTLFSAHGFGGASPVLREKTIQGVDRHAPPEVPTRLLICGGDGTVTWILTALERCKALEGKLHLLPVAVVPLGTGNDLARSLGWGASLRAVSDVLKYLEWVVQATPVTLDQWRIVLRPHGKLSEHHKLHCPGSHPQHVSDRALATQLIDDLDDALQPADEVCGEASDNVYIGCWQNYFSMGIDAKVAGYVDVSRNSSSCGRACFRRGCGKLCYGWQALRRAVGTDLLTESLVGNMKISPPADTSVSSSSSQMRPPAEPAAETQILQNLHPPLVEQNTTCGSRGRLRQVMLLNINSYCAGLNVLPRGIGDAGVPPSPADGVLEMLGLRNALHGLGVYARVASPKFLGSTRRLAFRLAKGGWMQVDGEPWHLDVGCDVLVEPHRKVTVLCAPREAPFWCGHCNPTFWKPPQRSAAVTTRS